MRTVGFETLMKAMVDLEKGNAPRIPQNESEVTFAPKIELEDCEIKWENSNDTIHNLIRGVNPVPGAWCKLLIDGQEKRLKIYSSLIRDDLTLPLKEMHLDSSKKVVVGCGKGSIELLEVQQEGKKKMSGADFYRGLPKAHWKISS
jgi:methionyl-tRNA formyltransferase